MARSVNELSLAVQPQASIRSRMSEWPGGVIVVAAVAFAVSAWLGLGVRYGVWADWGIEARPSVDALITGHLAEFLRLAPVYGGSLLLRAPFMVAAHLAGGGGAAVYQAGALPCLCADAALSIWLSGQLASRGCGVAAQAATIALCVASPFAVMTLQEAHPEDLLGAVLCVAAVLTAQRDRPLSSGVLVGLAIANKPWGILAAGPVLVALPGGRVRGTLAMLVTSGAVLAPFALVHAGSFVGASETVGTRSGTIFTPWQLWWFLGSTAPSGVQMAPRWLGPLGHTLPVAIMVPLSLAFAIRCRRRPSQRRGDAMLLLALLMLLRCALDPWDTVYYPVAFLLALLAWEATSFARPPVITLVATFVTWFAFQGATYVLGDRQTAQATIFLLAATAALSAVGRRLYASPTARTVRPSGVPGPAVSDG